MHFTISMLLCTVAFQSVCCQSTGTTATDEIYIGKGLHSHDRYVRADCSESAQSASHAHSHAPISEQLRDELRNISDALKDIGGLARQALLDQSSTMATLLAELIDFRRQFNDSQYNTPVATTNLWTHASSGCQCYFNTNRRDCACCNVGGCQCGEGSEQMCVPCGRSNMCHEFTRTTTGCTCYWDKSRKDCACCYDGGCQCPAASRHQCVQCGPGTMCGR